MKQTWKSEAPAAGNSARDLLHSAFKQRYV